MSRTATESEDTASPRLKYGIAVRKERVFLAFAGVLLCGAQALMAQVAKPAVTPNLGKLPLSFTANQGQVAQGVNFVAKGQGYGLSLTASEAVLSLRKPASRTSKKSMREISHLRMRWAFLSPAQKRRLARLSAGMPGSDTLHMELRGGNRQAQVTGADKLPGTTNYFIGNDPSRWRTRVPSFARVHYTGVYPGIDLIYYGNQSKLEYDFVVAPHVDPGQVELHFSGAQQLKLDHDGNLLVLAQSGEVAFEKPLVYQDDKGKRIPVKGQYTLLANHTVGFKVGQYDHSKTLVIDPTLSYSTYLGGSTFDAGTAVALDTTGNIYVTGFTLDTDFPVTAGAYQTTNPASGDFENEATFIAKLNPAGTALIYSTYLGAPADADRNSDTDGYGIAVDAAGSVYVCGETYSSEFPVTAGAYQTTNKAFVNEGQNAFLSKLSPDGSALVYSTYLGGSGLDINADFFDGDSPLRMTVDAAGSAYLVGTAYSTDFPTTAGAYQVTNKAAANAASNAFVTKFNPAGSALVYSTYLGGTGINPAAAGNDGEEGAGEAGYGIAVDGNGEAYVTGYTFSADFPVTGAGYQQANHAVANIGANAFVSKLNAAGTALVGSTYIGGTGTANGNGEFNFDATENGDDGIGLTLDAAGNAYIIGVSSSPDFPTTPGAYQTTNKAVANLATNAFVSKLDPTLSRLIYSTYVGGSGITDPDSNSGDGDFATGIVVDTAGNAYITGATESTDFPVTNDAFQAGPRSTQVVDSGFFTELNPAGTALTYSTYLGGSGAGSYGGTAEAFFEGDFFYDIALDASANIYLTGYAYSYDFPVTKDALQRVNNAGGGPGGNSFITKFGATPGATYLPTATTLSSTAAGSTLTFTAVVTPGTGTAVPTGTVSFYVAAVKAMTVNLDQTGTATYTNNSLTGTTDVIAAYSGDATYGASGSSLGANPVTPGNPPTQLVFTTLPAAAIGQAGNGGTAAVAVEDATGALVTTPQQAVTITIAGPAGSTPQTLTATSVDGIASFTFGNNPLTVPGIYSYIASSGTLISTTAFETVAPVITSISPNQLNVGSPATQLVLSGNFIGFEATNDVMCFSTPSGVNISAFTGNATSIQTTAQLAVFANAGHVQVYIGNGDCITRVSNTAVLNVTAVLPTSVATLAITPSPATYGKPITLTMTVAQENQTAPIPVTMGQVVFCSIPTSACNAQYNLGTAQLNGTGTASLSIYPASPGVLTYEALFLGTPQAGSVYSSSEANVTVSGTYPTTTNLTATGNPGFYALTGTVVGQGVSTLTPSGSVTIIDQSNGNAVVGTAALGAGTPAQVLLGAPGSPLTTGNAPYAVATGDFNRDGFTDFAVVNYNDGTVGIFLGNGDGTFKPPTTITVGTLPEGIAAADMNGDGILDLVVTNTGSDTVEVIDGKGDGTFPGGAGYLAGAEPAGIIVGDFNGDGRLDIAVSNYLDANIGIFLANQDGGFQQMVTYGVGNNPRTLTTGDFNGDGILDIAVANQTDNTLSIMFGNGDGTFQAQLLYPTGVSPQGIAVADFNGDGIPDLAFGNNGNGGETGSVGIMLGSGAGAFGNMTVYTAGGGPLGPVVGDFNGDGIADIAVENFNDDSETILLGNGDGTFQLQETAAVGTNPYAAAVGDFNGDGHPDLVISNFGSANESVLLDSITSTTTATLTSFGVPGAAGNHNIAAVFPGDTNFATSTSTAVPLMSTGNQLTPTTLALTANPTFSAVGQQVTLSATLAPYNGTAFTSNGETVTFLNGGTAIGTGTLANGVATLTTAALPAGANSLTVSYPGDANLAASVSQPLSYDVTGTGTATTVTALAVTAGGTAVTTVVSGTAVTLTATVAIATGAPVTPGLVTFCDAIATICENSAIVGTAQLTTSGTATFTFVPGIGSHSYKAVFAGTASNATSTSTAQSLTVSGTSPTATTITASGTPGDYTLTGTVLGTGGSYAKTSVFVIPTQQWTDTGISVIAGQALSISATGEMDWNTKNACGEGQTCTNGPDGSNPPTPCTGVAVTAPNLVCYSLIGMIGTNGTPFQVGASLNIAALPATGELYLGVNDGYFGDNTLGWTAFINKIQMPTGSVNFVDTTNGNTTLGTASLGAGIVSVAVVDQNNQYTVGPGGNSVVTGDFNGDGKIDLVVTSSGAATREVVLLLGDGAGGFATSLTSAFNPQVTALAVGDFNNDGKDDVAIARSSDNLVEVDLGNGTGLALASTTATGNQPVSPVVADFNGDGKADIAVANKIDNTLSILLGNGDGTFTAAPASPATGTTPTALAVGDFNGDGKADLAVANNSSGTITVLLGNGDGSFTAAGNDVAIGSGPTSIAVGDFNGDGKPDLAIAILSTNTTAGAVTVLLGNGDGTFSAGAGIPATGANPSAIVTGDFDGDGTADFAVASEVASTVTVYFGDGSGGVRTGGTATQSATKANPVSLATADFNGDGVPDLVTANAGSNNLTVLLTQQTQTATATLANVAVTGAAGNHSVVATYPGDANFTTSTSTATTLVAQGNISTPTIAGLAPNTAVAGSAATVVTITGTQFVTGAAVLVNGATQAAAFVSATQLTTTLTAAQLATAGTLNLVVVNPDTGTSNAAVFTVTSPTVSSPTITSLTPNAAYAGANAKTVTIAGTGFITGAAVTVNETSQAATFVSATQLTTRLTAAQLATAGTLTLTVVNPDGGTSNASAFTVMAEPLQLAPATLAFGNQTVGTSSAPQVVTVTNATTAAINITTIILDLGLNPGDFAQTNNCPATIEAEANCQITVIFTPGGVGPKSAGVQISDDTSLPNESVNLTGTGTGGILQVSPGNLKTIAGNGTAGYTGDGGAATAAELNDPDGVNFDAQGNLYIADVVNNVIRKVDTAGNITTVAGNGTAGFSGDGGAATAAELHGPFGVVPDAAGNLYIEDTLNARIRKVDTTGTITTIAGNGTFGFSGDGGPATAAEVAEVQGGRFDAEGNFYVAQCGPAAIRKIDTAGVITTVAGNGTDGFSGDGGPATSAQLNCASGVAIDAAGELFIADYLNNRIRKVDASGVITTIAGNGTPGYTGDNGPALAAEINFPNDVDVDAAGNIYIADSGNNRLRKIDTTGTITTLVGGLNNAGSAGVNAPSGIAFDTAGNTYFSDAGNNAVRQIFPAGALAFPTTPIGTAAANETVTLNNIGNVPVTIASQASFGLSGNTTDFSLAGGTCLAGATLTANGGSCTLAIGFTPTAIGTRTLGVSVTDDAVFSPQTFSISGVGSIAPAVVLNSIAPAGAVAGAADTTFTATGANFTPTAVVNFNGGALVTTFVSATQLTAVVPAALITTAGTANITVTDPFSGTTSQPAVFTILPGTPQVVTFTAPPASPGEQPTLNFSLTQGYPVAITGTMTLTFTPDAGNPDNPQIQLASATDGVTIAPGGRSLTFPLAANSTTTPVVLVQVGNVSGTITITLQLTAAGVNVTPTNVVPVTIAVPRVAPTISSLSFTTSGNTLTVLVTGFSTTREIQSATFTFTPASGASLNQSTFTVPANTLFTTWYTTADSAQFGSAFTYTQTFTLSGNASAIGGVGTTLTNTVGTSTEVTAP